MKPLKPLLALTIPLTVGAALLPSFPAPKDYPARMNRSFFTETSYVAQANGDLEDVKVRHMKRVSFTGTDPSPWADEAGTVTISTNIFLFELITTRAKNSQPKLTLEQWRAMQPPILKL